MLFEREGHPGRASCVLATEAASAIGYNDLTAPTERDLQRLVGNTIGATMADATASRTHSRLVRLALANSVSATPPLLTQDGKPPARTTTPRERPAA